MKTKIALSIGICLCQLLSLAAFDQKHQGARARGLANASVGLTDYWALYNNQAGLAYLEEITFGLGVHNHYLLNELNSSSLGIAFPLSHAGVLGLSLDNFGYNVYRENKIGIAFARSFGSNFSAGIKLNYLSLSMGKEYGSKSSIGFEIGLIYRIKQDFIFGFHASNPFSYRFSTSSKSRLPTSFDIGVVYQISEQIILSLACEKIPGRKAGFKTGMEYQVNNKVFIRAGISTSPFQFAFGFGYKRGKFKLDFASCYHRFLGFSPGISIIYSLSKKH